MKNNMEYGILIKTHVEDYLSSKRGNRPLRVSHLNISVIPFCDLL